MNGGIRWVIDDEGRGARGGSGKENVWSGQYDVIAMKKKPHLGAGQNNLPKHEDAEYNFWFVQHQP